TRYTAKVPNTAPSVAPTACLGKPATRKSYKSTTCAITNQIAERKINHNKNVSHAATANHHAERCKPSPNAASAARFTHTKSPRINSQRICERCKERRGARAAGIVLRDSVKRSWDCIGTQRVTCRAAKSHRRPKRSACTQGAGA